MGSPSYPWRAATESKELAAYREIFSDPEFFGLVGTRYLWLRGTVSEYAVAIDFVETLLELAETEEGNL